MAGSGRRFALEALLLVALAVAAGLAELSAAQIIAVMALGWLLTALIELVSWHLAGRRPVPLAAAPAPVAAEAVEPDQASAEAAAGEPEPDELAEPAEPLPGPEPVGEGPAGDAGEQERERHAVVVAGVDEPAHGEQQSEPEVIVPADDAVEDDAAAGESGRPRLEPLQPRPRRRPFWRRRSADPDEVEAEPLLERPSQRHVRLISRPPDEADDEDTAERRVEER